MKHTKLYRCLLALAVMIVASVGAMAQELSLKTVTFLKPGQKATIAVGLKNSSAVDYVQARIALPEGLSFVEEEGNAKAFANKAAGRAMDKMEFSCLRKDAQVGSFIGMGEVVAGEGDVFTFDVNVAADYTGTKQIELTKVQVRQNGTGLVKADLVTGKTASTADEVTVKGATAALTVGKPQTVTFNVAFDKTVLTAASFIVTLPKGVKFVDNSAAVGAICPNHNAYYTDGVYTIMVKNFMKDASFSATEGELGSFQIVADDTFVDGSEILFTNVRTSANIVQPGGSKKATEFLGADFAIKLTKGEVTGINGVTADELGADAVYQLNGVRTDQMKQGVNIVVKNGKAIKVLKK